MKRIVAKPLFWIVLISLLPVLSLLHPGMPFVHDGQDHVVRIVNFYTALKEGIIIPRWAANLDWGYGHPVLMFLYPLPEYLASAFHFIGFTLVDSTKLVFGLSFVASAITMFLWMSAEFGVSAGILGALLYSFAPYRFVDLHVRGALGEHIAFIFPPLILYFLRKRSYIGFSLSLAALILSHNAISLMFLPVVGLYGLYLLIFEEKKRLHFIISALLFTVFGFGLAAFFWLPALIEGKFTLRDIVTAGAALQRFVPWSWFVYSPWNYGGTDELTKSLGWPQWIGIIASGFFFVKAKEKKFKIFVVCLLAILFVSLFIQTAWSAPVWRASSLLQDFQFPWRFLSLSVFAAAVLGGIGLSKLPRSVFLIFCLFAVVITVNMWYPKGFQIHDDSFYSGIYPGTTDTGESSPVWSVRFMEHAPANPLAVIDGDATVTVGKRTTTEHNYILTVRKPTLMIENTLYFPKWTIYVNDEPTQVEWQNPTYRGIMTFRVSPGTVRVRVVFEDTRVRKIANIISVISIACIILSGVGVYLWRRKK